MSENETRRYKITAKKEQLDILESLFKTMQSMGAVGSSREIILYVDGDGAFRPKFTKFVHDEEMELNTVITPQSPDTISHGDGYIKRNLEDVKGDGFYIYYDFG